MAKQVGPLFITGTIDGVIFYQMDGKYYMRAKGAYRSGKQMRKDPKLKRTMANADQFGVASKIVKYTYYHCLPPEVRKFGLFAKLTGMVKRWLQEGKSKEAAESLLLAYCQHLLPKKKTTAPAIVSQLPASTNRAQITPQVMLQPITVPPTRKTKKARYLSQWKVKRCGRLQVPKSEAVYLQLRHETIEKDKARR